MSGILFVKTQKLAELELFYRQTMGMNLWLEQPNVRILQHGNFLLGLHQQTVSEQDGLITFFYPQKSDVDAMYQTLETVALAPPQDNPTYQIYNFFARDPEGRKIECQSFLHPVGPHLNGEELLLSRRSVRSFLPHSVSEEVLWQIFDECRYSPTSRNSESYYYVVVQKPKVQSALADIRPGASAPIGKSPLCVAVCVNPQKTKRVEEDGFIAAYHLLLAAWNYGLGTCWIADMNRPEVKQLLQIPATHFVATVTPLGYPQQVESLPQRRKAEEFVKFI